MGVSDASPRFATQRNLSMDILTVAATQVRFHAVIDV